MRLLVIVIAVFVILVGVVGLITPDRLLDLGRLVATSTGLYVLGALRAVIGLVLIAAAPRSRVPRIFRVVGAAVLVAGVATPFFGVDRTKAVLDWEATLGTVVFRAAGAIAIVIGSLAIFAVRNPKK